MAAKTIDPTVYLIEDDEGSRASTACLLGVYQIHAKCYESAEHFLSEVAEPPVGCIVTDLALPGMSGIELLRKSREFGWTIPVIVLTAFGDVATVVDAFKSGVHDFLEKPFFVATTDQECFRMHVTWSTSQVISSSKILASDIRYN